jgi:hypothetical protein
MQGWEVHLSILHLDTSLVTLLERVGADRGTARLNQKRGLIGSGEETHQISTPVFNGTDHSAIFTVDVCSTGMATMTNSSDV